MPLPQYSMIELPSKYAGQYLAFVDEVLVANGKTSLEVYTKAKKMHPLKLITLEYYPTKRETITFL